MAVNIICTAGYSTDLFNSCSKPERDEIITFTLSSPARFSWRWQSPGSNSLSLWLVTSLIKSTRKRRERQLETGKLTVKRSNLFSCNGRSRYLFVLSTSLSSHRHHFFVIVVLATYQCHSSLEDESRSGKTDWFSLPLCRINVVRTWVNVPRILVSYYHLGKRANGIVSMCQKCKSRLHPH